MDIDTSHITLPGPKEDGGFTLTFIRVAPRIKPASSAQPAPRPLSIIFLHAVASHKETWLPVIEHLFAVQQKATNNVFTVVEAWAMDAPSHGEAAIRNESLLTNFPNGLTGMQWAKNVQVLLKSGLIASNNIIGVGHSAGACVLVESNSGYPTESLPYTTLVLVEPTMMTRKILEHALDEGTVLLRAIEVARKRKDVWPSREAARQWFAKRVPWSRWHPRILDLYIEHALTDLPTLAYPDKTGVTLAITRIQEVGGYAHHEDGFLGLEMLKSICSTIPVHTIFGGEIDMVPAETQASIVDEADGRKMKSIVRVSGAGHLVVQESPRGVALALWGILHEDYGQSTPVSSRL
ncbi:hypothetical protein ACG7TL_003571 [Trametes sanguinea]